MITISVVLYKNTKEEIMEYIKMISPSKNSIEIVFVDNSPAPIYTNFEELYLVKYFFVNKNLGYGAGHNFAFKKRNKNNKYFIVSNLDINLSVKDLIHSVKYLSGEIFAISPNFIGKGSKYPRFFPFTGSVILRLIGRALKINFLVELVERNKLYVDSFRWIPIASGALILMKSKTFLNINGFNEKMWMYIEDWDLSRKLWNKGRILYNPNLRVNHHHTTSGIKSLKLSISFLLNLILFKLKYQFPYDFQRSKIHKICKNQILEDKLFRQ